LNRVYSFGFLKIWKSFSNAAHDMSNRKLELSSSPNNGLYLTKAIRVFPIPFKIIL